VKAWTQLGSFQRSLIADDGLGATAQTSDKHHTRSKGPQRARLSIVSSLGAKMDSHEMRLKKIRIGTADPGDEAQVLVQCVILEDAATIIELVKPGGPELLKHWDLFEAPAQTSLAAALIRVGCKAYQASEEGSKIANILEALFSNGFRLSKDQLALFVRKLMQEAYDDSDRAKAAIRVFRLLRDSEHDLKNVADHALFSSGSSILHWACESGCTDIVIFCVDELGCDVGKACFRNQGGKLYRVDPLALTFGNGHYEASNALLDRGALPVVKSDDCPGFCQPFMGLLTLATKLKPLEFVPMLKRVLREHKNVVRPEFYRKPQPDGSIFTPFVYALNEVNSAQVVELMLHSDLEQLQEAINTPSFLRGKGPIYPLVQAYDYWSYSGRDKELVYSFLEAGASVLVPSLKGVSFAAFVRRDTSCPRPMLLRIQAAEKKESKDKETADAAAKAEAVKVAKEGSLTNAPEDPSAKVLTEREEKSGLLRRKPRQRNVPQAKRPSPLVLEKRLMMTMSVLVAIQARAPMKQEWTRKRGCSRGLLPLTWRKRNSEGRRQPKRRRRRRTRCCWGRMMWPV
jgi:Ankyrin repeat